jgi:oligoendopeptidase F
MKTHVNWDLDSIFPGGSQSTALADYLDQITADVATAETQPLPGTLTLETQAIWVQHIQSWYDLIARLRQAGSFVTCLVSQNVKDDQALQRQGQIEELSARLGTIWTHYQATFAKQDDAVWDELIRQTQLKAVAFHLNEERDLARQKMPPELESLANELATDGYHAWQRLYNVTSGDKEIQFENQPKSLGQLQSKFYDDPDRNTRRAAFELFEAAWAELAKTCAMALNFQAGFRLTLYKHRGWDSILHEPLFNNRYSQKTLEAMWNVIEAKSAKLLDYFRAKARLLGTDGLTWYDVEAPIGSVNQTFSYPDAAAFCGR